MKQFLYILGFAVLFTGILGSCKQNTLDTLRENELVALDKYVKDNDLTTSKDDSGIYFKFISHVTDTVNHIDTIQIRAGYKAMLYYTITLLDSTVIFSTDDGDGHNYEEDAFYVDVNNTVVNASYVQQIAGLHRGLKKMHVGDTAFMVIPSELAFKAVDNTSLLGVPRFSTLLATVYVKRAYTPAEQLEQ
ncbi:MAG: FKBP-type peptidyl-prolyl cis-trans isomerase [Prolixibacteraceae bacterium]|jgi:hypothetical protein